MPNFIDRKKDIQREIFIPALILGLPIKQGSFIAHPPQ
jgi:hypothetical protein